MSPRNGIVLFGHGARDARWAEPFERLAGKLREKCSPDTEIGLAFLELMPPDLPAAVAAQVAAGCSTVTIVPVFIGMGGHIRRDLPAIVDQCRAAHPAIRISFAAPVGEDEAVLDALAAYCLSQLKVDRAAPGE
jgi:sirohydrochlorin cobaltochelatase